MRVILEPGGTGERDPFAWSLAQKLLRSGAAVTGKAEAGDLTLDCSSTGLTLRSPSPGGRPLELRLDFASGRQGYRLAHAAHSREDLVRALGHPPRASTILDASAGLGRDSLVLAARDFRVVMFERQPVLAALLADALNRARCHPALKPVIERVDLRSGDVREWTQPSGHLAAAAVFDPMFPVRSKDAAVKKEMLVLQQLLGKEADVDAPATLTHLLGVAKRVVVKRPLHAPPLDMRQPAYSIRGRSTRFDVYLGHVQ